MKFKSPYKPPTLIGHETNRENVESWPNKERFMVKNVTSTVKIKPIDPYKFCESATNHKKDELTSKALVKTKNSLKVKVIRVKEIVFTCLLTLSHQIYK